MAHTSQMRWTTVVEITTASCQKMVETLLSGKREYDDLLELYQYVGNTTQGLADLLFQDQWSLRQTPGENAVLTFDVVGGSVTAINVVNAGTAYTISTGNTLSIQPGSFGGEISYDVIDGSVANVSLVTAGSGYTNGTSQPVTNMPQSTGTIRDTQANADEVALAQDVVDAMTALNNIHTTADFSKLRRFT